MSRLRDRRDTVLWVREPRTWGHPPSTGPSVPVLSVGDYEPRDPMREAWPAMGTDVRAPAGVDTTACCGPPRRTRTLTHSRAVRFWNDRRADATEVRRGAEPQTARLRPAGERGPRPPAALGRLPSNALLRPARLVAPSPSPPPAPPPPAGQTPRGGPPPLRALASVCRGRMVHVKRSLR